MDIDLTEISLDNINGDMSTSTSKSFAIPAKQSSSLDNKFGGGIDLILGDDKPTKSGNDNSNDIELEQLEIDLNNLTGNTQSSFNMEEKDINLTSLPETNGNESSGGGIGSMFSSFMNGGGDKGISSVGKETSKLHTSSSTWDGYSNIGVNAQTPEPSISKSDLRRKKYDLYKKLSEYESRGEVLSKHYSMESDYNDMLTEYEYIKGEKEKKTSIEFQFNTMEYVISSIEMFNENYDLLGLKLSGLKDAFRDKKGDFDDIFGELHDKYADKVQIMPEMKLIFQIIATAGMVNLTNKLLERAMPSFESIIRNNPEIANRMTSAALDSMHDEAPGLSSFINKFGEPTGQTKRNNLTKDPPSNDEYAKRINEHQRHVSNVKSETMTQKRAMRPEMKGPNRIPSNLMGKRQQQQQSVQKEMPTTNLTSSKNKSPANTKKSILIDSKKARQQALGIDTDDVNDIVSIRSVDTDGMSISSDKFSITSSGGRRRKGRKSKSNTLQLNI